MLKSNKLYSWGNNCNPYDGVGEEFFVTLLQVVLTFLLQMRILVSISSQILVMFSVAIV